MRVALRGQLKGILVSAFDALDESLDHYTLADLVERAAAPNHEPFRPPS